MNKNKTLIIAEAGVNHNGNLQQALKLIEIAANSGADFIKFQTFTAEKLTSKKAKKASYQIKLDDSDNQYSMLEKLEIPEFWYPILIKKCKEENIKFLTSGFDEESIDFIEKLNLSFYKIPSGEITNKPYLEHISKKGKNIIISTGMSNLKEIRQAIKILTSNGLSKDNITVLHCNSEYPTPYEDVNLNSILYLKEKLGLQVGYSDHSRGIEVPIAAVALGAIIIEKHFTLNKNFIGPDHKASLSPVELKKMIKSIRNIEKSLGSFGKKITLSEKKNLSIVRKSIHLNKSLKKGAFLEAHDLIMLRPGDGISPLKIDDIIGKRVTKNLIKGHKLLSKDFK